jgi:hypothetical protein
MPVDSGEKKRPAIRRGVVRRIIDDTGGPRVATRSQLSLRAGQPSRGDNTFHRAGIVAANLVATIPISLP